MPKNELAKPETTSDLSDALDTLNNLGSGFEGETYTRPSLDTIGLRQKGSEAYDTVGEGSIGDFYVGKEATLGTSFNAIPMKIQTTFDEVFEFGTKDPKETARYNTLADARLAGWDLKKPNDPKEGNYVVESAVVYVLVSLADKPELGERLANAILINDDYYIPARVFVKGMNYRGVVGPIAIKSDKDRMDKTKKGSHPSLNVWSFKTEKKQTKNGSSYHQIAIKPIGETPSEVINFVANAISTLG